MMQLFRILALFAALALALGGCASTGDKGLSKEDEEKNASSLYIEAKQALDAGDYETAIKRLESLEARFPFGKYAQQAQLDIAYAYYRFDEPDSAIAAADRFIKLYPRHPKVDYAYYMKGVIKFNLTRSWFDRFPGQDPAKRDTDSARRAFQYFAEMVQRFPNSSYAEDAVERMAYLRNNLARSEIFAAKHYMERGAYVAALNRAKHVLERFQRTPSCADALVVTVQAYRKLALDDLAEDTLRILELNYPERDEIAVFRGKKKELNS